MPPQVMSGARAKIGYTDPSSGITRFFGIFESISYGMQIDVSPVFLLGRWTAAALEYTSVEPVQVSTTGWRVVNHGPHTDGRMPKVQDIMKHEYMTIVVVDRLTLQAVATIKSVRPTSYNTGFAARQLSQMSMSYMGILADDESSDNSEPADSTTLPATS